MPLKNHLALYNYHYKCIFSGFWVTLDNLLIQTFLNGSQDQVLHRKGGGKVLRQKAENYLPTEHLPFKNHLALYKYYYKCIFFGFRVTLDNLLTQKFSNGSQDQVLHRKGGEIVLRQKVENYLPTEHLPFKNHIALYKYSLPD